MKLSKFQWQEPSYNAFLFNLLIYSFFFISYSFIIDKGTIYFLIQHINHKEREA
jgi:hypothetical protein